MHRLPALLLTLLGTALLVAAPTAPAYAHPLGNFTVNRYDGLLLEPNRIQDSAVVDTAEIPTLQDRSLTDTNHDGRITPAEAAARAVTRCAQLASGISATVGGGTLAWTSGPSTLTYRPGAAGLPTARLTCQLSAPVDLGHQATLSFESGADPERVGWKEITARADHLALASSTVPVHSISNDLLDYPTDLLGSPLDCTHATTTSEPSAHTDSADAAPGTRTGAARILTGTGVLFPGLERRVDALTTTRRLALPTGALAVALALLLGAGHAALPGHAKLVMASCLAQRRSRLRGALTVGTTVTLSHTAGVLLTGLALTASMSLAGEQLLGWLQAAGGLITTGLGIALASTAVRRLRHTRRHAHSHPHPHSHTHSHSHSHSHSHGNGRLTLLGAGLAGGLVPSPSALVMLLGAVALGRTAFGILLVLGYGLGMALTLTAAGLLLTGTGSRLGELGRRRLPALHRWAPYGNIATATAVLIVGISLTATSLP